jgi:hypothetical protein
LARRSLRSHRLRSEQQQQQQQSEQRKCAICHSESEAEGSAIYNRQKPLQLMVECAKCHSPFHYSCLVPPLDTPPASEDWYCADCLATGEDYSFEDGPTVHTLSSFQQMADLFKAEYCQQHRLAGDDCSAVEREFWRLCQSVYDGNLQVEYGADLHSSELGRY